MNVRHENPDSVAAPTGAYSLVSIAPTGAQMAWIAGQTGRAPDGSFPDTAVDQTRQALDNLAGLVEAIGATPLDILHFRSLLVGREAMPGFVLAREECFGSWYRSSPPPTSTVAFVAGLVDPRALIEMEAVVAVAVADRPTHTDDSVFDSPPLRK